MMCVSAFKSGLQPGPFNNDLNRKLPKTFQELKARADGFIVDEEHYMNKRAISFQTQTTKSDKGKSTANESKAKQQDNSRPFYAGRQDRGGPYQGKSKNNKWERPAASAAPLVLQANMVGTPTRSPYQILKNLQQVNLITMPAPPKRQPKHADPNL
jgi:hypothetical protein